MSPSTGALTSVDDFYARALRTPSAITAHLPRLRALAEGGALAVEFGVKRGASSSALLLGAKHVISYDIVETADARLLQRLAGDRWEYRLKDSRTADVTPCELLFIDSRHDYEQCSAELARHGAAVQRWLVFHDHLTFGVIGADGETGRLKWSYAPGLSVPLNCLGIRHAIDEFQIAHPEWRIQASYPDSHGLLVLERRP